MNVDFVCWGFMVSQECWNSSGLGLRVFSFNFVKAPVKEVKKKEVWTFETSTFRHLWVRGLQNWDSQAIYIYKYILCVHICIH